MLPHDYAKLVAPLLAAGLGGTIAHRLGRTEEIHIGLRTNLRLYSAQRATYKVIHRTTWINFPHTRRIHVSTGI